MSRDLSQDELNEINDHHYWRILSAIFCILDYMKKDRPFTPEERAIWNAIQEFEHNDNDDFRTRRKMGLLDLSYLQINPPGHNPTLQTWNENHPVQA